MALALAISAGCAATHKVAVYSESALRAGVESWDRYYRSEAERCGSRYEPKTPEMETCFGATYDADAKVAKGIESAVAILRAYWAASAAGQKPDWQQTALQIQKILEELPEEARRHFENVLAGGK